MLRFLKDFLFEENEAAPAVESLGAVDTDHADAIFPEDGQLGGGQAESADTVTFQMPVEEAAVSDVEAPQEAPEHPPIVMDLNGPTTKAAVLDLETKGDNVIDISGQMEDPTLAPTLGAEAEVIDVSDKVGGAPVEPAMEIEEDDLDYRDKKRVKPEVVPAVETPAIEKPAEDNEVSEEDVEKLKAEVTAELAANAVLMKEHEAAIAQIERDKQAAIAEATDKASEKTAEQERLVKELEAKNAALQATAESLATLGAGIQMIEKEEAEIDREKEQALTKLKAARATLDANRVKEQSPTNKIEQTDHHMAA
jgi:hypothetical protein